MIEKYIAEKDDFKFLRLRYQNQFINECVRKKKVKIQEFHSFL